MKMPTTIGGTIDLLFKLREERKSIEAKAEAVREKEKTLEEHLLNNFEQEHISGSKGKLAQASIKHNTVPEVQDWDAFYRYISRNKAWDLLQKRPSVTGLRERWDAHKEVPGVKSRIITSLSLTKLLS